MVCCRERYAGTINTPVDAAIARRFAPPSLEFIILSAILLGLTWRVDRLLVMTYNEDLEQFKTMNPTIEQYKFTHFVIFFDKTLPFCVRIYSTYFILPIASFEIQDHTGHEKCF